MRRWRRVLAAAMALGVLAGCGAAPAEEGEERWDPEKANLLGLTQEQRLEDYDYFVRTLGDSYLCMGVRDRDNPDDPSADLFREYRAMIEGSDSDEVFYTALYSTLYRLGSYGHLWIIEPEGYREMLDWCQGGETQGRERWRVLLEDPGTQAGYEKLQTLLDSYGEESGGSGGDNRAAENLHTRLLPGGVGYVKIDGFPADYAADREQLFSFYDTLEGCTDLIFDVTDNGGGSEPYWQDLLVAPFLDAPLSCTNYALLADSENNRPFIENVFAPEELRPIRELPDLPKLNREGLEGATHFVESTLTASPGDYRAPFRGRVWVLVGPWVYSASESFAVFCKATGFAQLVGQTTGGDGIGALDPVLMRLPNSGLLIQYTMMFGLNPDGSSSEEAGTAPDLPSPAGEPALATALGAIAAARTKPAAGTVSYENVELRSAADGRPYLHSIRVNQTGKAIAGTKRCMLAYDETGQPLKLQWHIMDSSDRPAYACLCDDGEPLSPGQRLDGDGGWSLYDGEVMPDWPKIGDGGPNRVAYALFCNQRITFADGTVWENPDYENWLKTYAGKPVSVEILQGYYPFVQTVTA